MIRKTDETIALQQAKSYDRRISSNMAIFLIGLLVSLLGSRIMSFAIGLYVLKITGSGMSFAFTLIISMLPAIILSPIAGTIADQSNRKLIIVLMDALSGLFLIGIFFIAIKTSLSLLLIYVCIFFLSVFNTFFKVAMEASIPNIVDEKRLTKINSYSSSIVSLAAILGPALGGIVYGYIDMESFILINGVSFILSAISEMFIDFNIGGNISNQLEKKEYNSILKEMMEGISYLKTRGMIIYIMIFSIFINFVYSGYMVALPYIVNTKLRLTSDDYGLIQAALAFGSLLFSLLFSIIKDDKNKHSYIYLSMLVISILMMITGIPSLEYFKTLEITALLVYFCLINFFIGGAIPFINIPLFTLLQKQIPDEYRGRINGLLGTMALSIAPVGLFLGGVAIDLFPSIILPIICGILFLILSIVIYNKRELRSLL